MAERHSMHVVIVAQYFWPEDVGPGVFLHQLGTDLVRKGHRVTMLTAFPNYPEGRIHDVYRGRLFMRESVDGVEVVRTWIYATPSKSFWPRVMSFGSFSASAPLGGMTIPRVDVVYCVIPPLPLAVSCEFVAKAKGAALVINVQDIYPDIAVSLGYLKNRAAIYFFRAMERWIYRRAARIVVISERFQENLLAKGVPANKINVVSNWADAMEIHPGPRQNDFRRELGIGSDFTVVYSGGITHNSALEAAVEAVRLLRDEPVQFVIVGDGVHKRRLEELARQHRLEKIRFLPFQPRDKYPQVLAAGDVQLVSTNVAGSQFSLPSKVLKIMAAGRPILAQATAESDVARLLHQGGCGVVVHPDDAQGLADAIRSLRRDPERLERMGENARGFFLQHFDRLRCVDQLESVMLSAAARKGSQN